MCHHCIECRWVCMVANEIFCGYPDGDKHPIEDWNSETCGWFEFPDFKLEMEEKKDDW